MPDSPVIVITGAGSGIGASLAKAYADTGARLALADLNPERLAQVAQGLRGAQVLTQAFDVSDEAAWAAFAQTVVARWGVVDVVINNAGVALSDTVSNMKTSDAQWLIGVNWWGVFHGSRAFLPQLTAPRSNRLHRPCIVNISSVFAFVSMPTQSVYNASKAAVRAFCDSLREELRGHGVQVLCVHPGGIKTRIAQDGRLGDLAGLAADPQSFVARFDQFAPNSPAFAACKILRAQQRGQSRLRIGADAWLGDVLHRLFPASVSRWFTALMYRAAARQSQRPML